MKGSSFDFTALFKIQQDMKNGFRNLKLSEQRFKKALSRSHNRFFQRILAEKKTQYQLDREEVRHYKGGEGVVIEGKSGDIVFEEDLRAQLPAQSKRRKNLSKPKKFKTVVQATLAMNRMRESSRHTPTQLESPKEEDQKVVLGRESSSRLTGKAGQIYNKMKAGDEASFQHFFKLMQQPDMRRRYAKQILDTHNRADVQIGELASMLEQSTLRLFCELRDRTISLEQFKARILEREMNLKYTCIDDLGAYLKKPGQLPMDVENRSEIMYQKKFSEVTIGEILQPREPWKVNKRCLRSIISLSRPRTALTAKKRNNIVFEKKNQKRKSPSPQDAYRATNKSVLDDDILTPIRRDTPPRKASSYLCAIPPQFMSGQISISSSKQDGDERLKQEEEEESTRQETRSPTRTMYLTNRADYVQNQKDKKMKLPDPFKMEKVDVPRRKLPLKKERRATTAPRVIKKKESLSFLNRFEELNEIVIRASGRGTEESEQQKEAGKDETGEILKKANSVTGPRVQRGTLRPRENTAYYLRSEKQMSQTSFSTRWPPSPMSDIEPKPRIEKVLMDVDTIGGVSRQFKNFIKALGVPVLKSVKTQPPPLPQRQSSTTTQSPYASVPQIPFPEVGPYAGLMSQSSSSYLTTPGDYQTKAIQHRLGVGRRSGALNQTFF